MGRNEETLNIENYTVFLKINLPWSKLEYWIIFYDHSKPSKIEEEK